MDAMDATSTTLFNTLHRNNLQLRALTNDSRQRLIIMIRQTADHGVLKVSELAEAVGLSQPATSHHLRILREAGIVQANRQGNIVYYELTLDKATAALAELLNLLQSIEA